MKDLTEQFLDFLEADPDKVYDTSDSKTCAFHAFLTRLGFPVEVVGCYMAWGRNGQHIEIPEDVRPFHYSSPTWNDSQTYGQLAERIRQGRTNRTMWLQRIPIDPAALRVPENVSEPSFASEPA